MVTIDDIATGISTLFQGNNSIPGQAWFDRAPPTTASWPYARFKIEKGDEPQFTSDGSYLQTWFVMMAAYTRQGVDAVPNAVQIAMNQVMNSSPGVPSQLTLRSGTVLHVLPRGVDGDFDPKLWDGRNVFVAAASWEILLQGNVGS